MKTKLFWYDLETTGLRYWKHGIHQIAGLIEIDGEVVEKFNFDIAPHPQHILEPEAFTMKAIKPEEVRNYPALEVVFKEKLMPLLNRYISPYDSKDKFFTAGYNISAFDNPFFRKLFDLSGTQKSFGNYFWNEPVDVFCLASEKLLHERANMKAFNQAAVAEHLGLPVRKEELHDASYDVELSRQIYQMLKLW